MKHIILVRHAKSSWALPSLSDFDRPLNKRGKRDAPAMGKRMAGEKMVPDKIISSPATRAISTARTLAKSLDIPRDKIREERMIYEASSMQLLGFMRGWKEKWETVMTVGHMPGIGDLAQLLLEQNIGPIPTCSVVEIELDVDSWADVAPGCGRLIRMMKPKDTAK
jgi:phosphohistidine phosphatase